MKPTDYLALAGRIAAFGKAGARSAVSRAYYAAFHSAIEMLDRLECGLPRSGQSHALVHQVLSYSNHPAAKLASMTLSDLHSERIRADYRLDDLKVEGLAAAQSAVEASANVIEALSEFEAACVVDAVKTQFTAEVAKLKKLRGIA